MKITRKFSTGQNHFVYFYCKFLMQKKESHSLLCLLEEVRFNPEIRYELKSSDILQNLLKNFLKPHWML